MTPTEHWLLRGVSLLIILACCARCTPKETTTINVPASSYTPSNYSHHLTAEEEWERAHPAPIAPKNLDGYFAEYQWWVK